MHVETLNIVVTCPPTHRFARRAPDQHGQRGVRPAALAGERFVAFDRKLPLRREVGMNRAARWDALTMYDKGDINGTEQRAFAGNFLYSTGANEFAKRFTSGHFDLPMRNCSVELDGDPVVVAGELQAPLA